VKENFNFKYYLVHKRWTLKTTFFFWGLPSVFLSVTISFFATVLKTPLFVSANWLLPLILFFFLSFKGAQNFNKKSSRLLIFLCHLIGLCVLYGLLFALSWSAILIDFVPQEFGKYN